MIYSDRFLDRFWAKVDVRAGKCWEWTACTTVNGYGEISVNGQGKKMLHAHRVSWKIHKGEIPDGMWVLHECDNPPCVNPEHLFLGTHDDNMADMTAKGQSAKGTKNAAAKLRENQVKAIRRRHNQCPRGEDHPKAKLTENQVITIRELYAGGKVLQRQLGKMYGVSATHIGRIVRFEKWAHVEVENG